MEDNEKKKFEFSKIVLALVMVLYLGGAILGGIISIQEHSLLGNLLEYLKTPTMTAIGFYAWKSKAENVLKIDPSKRTKNKIVDKAFNSSLYDDYESSYMGYTPSYNITEMEVQNESDDAMG